MFLGSCMSETTQDYGPIASDYAFFQAHTTERERDVAQYAATVAEHGLGTGPIRLLDFGCGDGGFSKRLLATLAVPADRLNLTLIEPETNYRHHAVDAVTPFSSLPVEAYEELPKGTTSQFDLIVANHCLYYVPDLAGTVPRLLDALATPGLFTAAMAGPGNHLNEVWAWAFGLLGEPIPYHDATTLSRILTDLGVSFETRDVAIETSFPDTAENRLRIIRFLTGKHFADLPKEPMLAIFDPYAVHGCVRMPSIHQHFVVRKP